MTCQYGIVNRIKCHNCNKVIHGPNAKSKSQCCSLLNIEEFNLYTNPSINKEWICPKCCANKLPFYDLSTNDLHFENIIPHNAKGGGGGINLILNNNLEDFVKKCNSTSTNPKDDQNDGDDLFNNINFKYYNMFEFNRIKNNLSWVFVTQTLLL